MRLLSVVLFFIALFWIAAIVFLAPSFIVLRANIDDTNAEIKAIQSQRELSEAKGLESQVSDARKLLSLVSASSTGEGVATIFKRILALKNAGVALSTISMPDTTHMQLHGTARDRQTLQTFVKNIEADGHVAHVDSPLSNFIAEKDILFSISVQWNQ